MIFLIFLRKKNSLKSRKIRLKTTFFVWNIVNEWTTGTWICPPIVAFPNFTLDAPSSVIDNLYGQYNDYEFETSATRWILLGLKQIFKNTLCPNYSPFPLDLIGISGKQWRKFYCSQRYHACYQNKIDSRSSNRLVSLHSHESGILWLL